jgi:hypothetical protein
MRIKLERGGIFREETTRKASLNLQWEQKLRWRVIRWCTRNRSSSAVSSTALPFFLVTRLYLALNVSFRSRLRRCNDGHRSALVGNLLKCGWFNLQEFCLERGSIQHTDRNSLAKKKTPGERGLLVLGIERPLQCSIQT